MLSHAGLWEYYSATAAACESSSVKTTPTSSSIMRYYFQGTTLVYTTTFRLRVWCTFRARSTSSTFLGMVSVVFWGRGGECFYPSEHTWTHYFRLVLPLPCSLLRKPSCQGVSFLNMRGRDLLVQGTTSHPILPPVDLTLLRNNHEMVLPKSSARRAENLHN